jgi:GST-like protein
VFLKVSANGPIFGRLVFLRWGGTVCRDKWRRQRFTDEYKRLLGILGRRLEGHHLIINRYSIAGIVTLDGVNALVESDDAGDIIDLGNLSNIQAWLGCGQARPAVQRGLHIPTRPA